MDGCPGWVQNNFHPIYGPTATHEHQGYHMDLEDRLTPASSLVSKFVYEGHQAEASAMGKLDDGSYHAGQYSLRTFWTKG